MRILERLLLEPTGVPPYLTPILAVGQASLMAERLSLSYEPTSRNYRRQVGKKDLIESTKLLIQIGRIWSNESDYG